MHFTSKTFALAALILSPLACGGSAASSTASTDTGASSTTGTGGKTAGTAGTAGTGGSGPSGQTACAEEAAALCTLRDTCSPNFNNKHVYGTEAVCQSRTAQTCVNALDASGTGNTPTKVEACAAAYPSEMCVDFFDGNPVTACVPPAGTLATGKACGASGQCASTFCALGQYTVCATCQALPAVGATCQVQDDCGRDLACAIPTVNLGDAGVPTSGLCAAFVKSGGACLTGFNPCQAGLACVGDDQLAMTMGTCQPAGATVGAACQTTRKKAANCDNDLGLVCIATTATPTIGTCQAIKLVAAGQPCGDMGTPPTSFAECTAGGRCNKESPTDLMGTCVAAAADGADCDNDPTGTNAPCLAPAKCVVTPGSPGTAGKCTVPDAAACM
jgi:hypothetical protein